MTEQQCPYTRSALGTRYQPFSGAQLEDPYAFYATARREEPIFFGDRLKMWIVTCYDDVHAVLREPNLFSSQDSIKSIDALCPEALAVLRTGVPPVPFIINTDPPEHSRFRRVINRAFSGARIQALEPQIRTITQSLLDVLAPQGCAEVISALVFPLPLRVIARLCDIDDRHIEDLKRWGQDFLALMSSVMPPERQVAVAQSVVAYQHFMREHIARKREHPGEDITSTLIAGGGDALFSEPELVHQMMGLVSSPVMRRSPTSLATRSTICCASRRAGPNSWRPRWPSLPRSRRCSGSSPRSRRSSGPPPRTPCWAVSASPPRRTCWWSLAPRTTTSTTSRSQSALTCTATTQTHI